jgi:hypothetical protein
MSQCVAVRGIRSDYIENMGIVVRIFFVCAEEPKITLTKALINPTHVGLNKYPIPHMMYTQ